MKVAWLLAVGFVAWRPAPAEAAAPQDPAKHELQVSLKDIDLPGTWIYDDLAAGFARAKESGRPLLVVFR